MHKNNADEIFNNIERSVSVITKQIEILSKKCQLEENKKNSQDKFENAIKTSELILLLTKSLNELLATQGTLKYMYDENHYQIISNILGKKN